MKAEVIRGNLFKSNEQLRRALGYCINKYYNATRMYVGINYCSPIEYEAIAG